MAETHGSQRARYLWRKNAVDGLDVVAHLSVYLYAISTFLQRYVRYYLADGVLFSTVITQRMKRRRRLEFMPHLDGTDQHAVFDDLTVRMSSVGGDQSVLLRCNIRSGRAAIAAILKHVAVIINVPRAFVLNT